MSFPRYVAIVGPEAGKFTRGTETEAREIIRRLLAGYGLLTASRRGRSPLHIILVSGHCPHGGTDLYAEEEDRARGGEPVLFRPSVPGWEFGYKPRNLQIAERCDEIHVVTVARYPEGYRGSRFQSCYHCHSADHVKSGGCWTARQAVAMGKPAHWHIIGG